MVGTKESVTYFPASAEVLAHTDCHLRVNATNMASKTIPKSWAKRPIAGQNLQKTKLPRIQRCRLGLPELKIQGSWPGMDGCRDDNGLNLSLGVTLYSWLINRIPFAYSFATPGSEAISPSVKTTLNNKQKLKWRKRKSEEKQMYET